jgi:hypothetical protein
MDSERVDTTTGVQLSELKEIVLRENRPVTEWEIAGKVGDRSGKQVRELLEELTARGHLARFNAGLNRYYAAPKVALTDARPLLVTVLRNSFRVIKIIPRTRTEHRKQVSEHPQTVTG